MVLAVGGKSPKMPGMAIFDPDHEGYRVFVGNLGTRVGKYELEKDFEYIGPITDVWVAR